MIIKKKKISTARKRLKQNIKSRSINKITKLKVKNSINAIVNSNEPNKLPLIYIAQSFLDKAAKKGVLTVGHTKRMKSKLYTKYANQKSK